MMNGLLFSALLWATTAGEEWTPLPADAAIPPMMFSCRSSSGLFHDLLFRMDETPGLTKVGIYKAGGREDVKFSTVSSIARRSEGAGISYRVIFKHPQDRLQLKVELKDPTRSFISNAAFVLTRGAEVISAKCERAPDPIGGWQ